MTKKEEVARALGARRGLDWDLNREQLLDWAEAALQAMRIPNEAMRIAARDWSAAKYGRPVGHDGTDGCWQSQIDAALKETP